MKKLTKRDKMNLIVSLVLILFGIILLIYPIIGNLTPNKLLYVTLGVYGVIKLFEYLNSDDKKDREDLYTSIACLLAALSGVFFYNNSSNTVLALTLAIWTGVMSIIKLIKLDYYHDRGHEMFYTNLITFVLFLSLGLLTSINFYFDYTVQTIVLGYFFIINGLLNLLEDAVRISFKKK